MAKLTLILGGVRSGKSRRAMEIAGDYPQVTFVASAQPVDEEMAERIERHRAERPAHWQTVEAHGDLPKILSGRSRGNEHLFLFDCLTIYLARLMEEGGDQGAIEAHIGLALETAAGIPDGLVVVANEVGMGVVPPYPQGRLFRDVLGSCNQLAARAADEVYLMAAGLPLRLK